MPDRRVELVYPLAGVDRSVGYPQQPPYSAVDALNVRAMDVLEGRARGGSRPGSSRIFQSRAGDQNTAIRMLAGVQVVNNTQITNWEDDFAWRIPGQDISAWWGSSADIAWWTGIDGGPAGGGGAVGAETFDFPGQTVRDCLMTYGDFGESYSKLALVRSAIAMQLSYTIELSIVPSYQVSNLGPTISGVYYIFFLMNDSSPDASTAGYVACIDLDGENGSYSGGLYCSDSASSPSVFNELATWSASATIFARRNVFRVSVTEESSTGMHTITVQLNDTDLLSATEYDDVTDQGQRVGFAIARDASYYGQAAVDLFRIQEALATPSQRRILCCTNTKAAGGAYAVYKDNARAKDEWTELGFASALTSPSIASDRTIFGEELGQKLYIADVQDCVFSGQITAATLYGNGHTSNPFASGACLIDTGVASWQSSVTGVPTAAGPDGNNPESVGVELSGITTPGIDGFYHCDRGTAADAGAVNELRLTPSPVALGSNAVSVPIYRFYVLPKVFWPTRSTSTAIDCLFSYYDSSVGGSIDTRSGATPLNCPNIQRWNGRIVFSGHPPHVWYMSRQGDPTDWDFSQTDAQAAVAGTNSSIATVGERITSMVAHSDDYLIFGCTRSIWVMRGDPRLGGQLMPITQAVGMARGKSWCHGPGGETYALTTAGLYVIPPGAATIQPVSPQRLQRDLIGITGEQHDVTLLYDQREQGVQIHLTPKPGSVVSGLSWFYDVRNGGLWPDKRHTNTQALCGVDHTFHSPADSGSIIGVSTGLILKSSKAVLYDDFRAPEGSNYIMYGPLRLGGGVGLAGILNSIAASLDLESGDVTWSLHGGDTPEDAQRAAAFASGNLSAGLNYTEHPRMRAGWAYLKLTSRAADADSELCLTPWAIDTIGIGVQSGGLLRKE